MIHFTAEQWFEYARDSEPAEQRLPMERHLADGCDGCQRLFAMWREVLEIGARESRYHPPPGLVRSAKAAFPSGGRWKWFPEIAQAAQVIFDSLLEPIPEGVRGSAPARQFLQEAKPFVVDMRVEFEPARQWVRLAGQVLNAAEPQNNVSDVEIFLLKGEQLIGNTTANASAEFELEFKDDEDLQLFVDIRGRKVIEIRLPTYMDIAKE